MNAELSPPVLYLDRYGNEPYNLITNPEAVDPDIEIKQTIDPAITAIREDLHRVLIGDGQNPHCPFVKMIENQNGYYIRTDSRPPQRLTRSGVLTNAGKRGVEEFRRISPAPTHMDQVVDPTAYALAFTHPDAAEDRGFLRKLDGVQRFLRPQFLKEGLMLSQMHAQHPRTERDGYRFQIPMLITRRMHRQDKVFMTNPDEMNIHRRFFPDNREI